MATICSKLDRREKNNCRLSWEFQEARPTKPPRNFGLTFTSDRRLPPKLLRTHLTKLGVSPNLIKMAIDTIEGRAKESFPRIDPVQFDIWFRSLRREVRGERLKAVVAATPESLAKWERKLKKFGRSWKNIELSDGAVIGITVNLFLVDQDQSVTSAAIGRRFRHWKKDQKRIYSGWVARTFTYKYNILAQPERTNG